MDSETVSAIAALQKSQQLAEKRFVALEAENKKLKAGKAEQDRHVTELEKRNKQQEKKNKLQAKEIQAIKGQLKELQPLSVRSALWSCALLAGLHWTVFVGRISFI